MDVSFTACRTRCPRGSEYARASLRGGEDPGLPGTQDFLRSVESAWVSACVRTVETAPFAAPPPHLSLPERSRSSFRRDAPRSTRNRPGNAAPKDRASRKSAAHARKSSDADSAAAATRDTEPQPHIRRPGRWD